MDLYEYLVLDYCKRIGNRPRILARFVNFEDAVEFIETKMKKYYNEPVMEFAIRRIDAEKDERDETI